MRILALDYGAARIGCAISDRSGTLATPIPSVASGDPGALAALADDRGAERAGVHLDDDDLEADRHAHEARVDLDAVADGGQRRGRGGHRTTAFTVRLSV